eukprot:5688179-Prymnesium_polylepis.1
MKLKKASCPIPVHYRSATRQRQRRVQRRDNSREAGSVRSPSPPRTSRCVSAHASRVHRSVACVYVHTGHSCFVFDVLVTCGSATATPDPPHHRHLLITNAHPTSQLTAHPPPHTHSHLVVVVSLGARLAQVTCRHLRRDHQHHALWEGGRGG